MPALGFQDPAEKAPDSAGRAMLDQRSLLQKGKAELAIVPES